MSCFSVGQRVWDLRNINDALGTVERAALACTVTEVQASQLHVQKRSGEPTTIPIEFVLPDTFVCPPPF